MYMYIIKLYRYLHVYTCILRTFTCRMPIIHVDVYFNYILKDYTGTCTCTCIPYRRHGLAHTLCVIPYSFKLPGTKVFVIVMLFKIFLIFMIKIFVKDIRLHKPHPLDSS